MNSTNYLTNTPIYNYDKLVSQICNENYTLVDGRVPFCRYRGTSIYQTDSGYIITGWNRNIGHIGQLVFSFPCILKIHVDFNGIIIDISIDSSFRGSKGLLCDRKILDVTAKKILIGKNIETLADENIGAKELQCFHVFEIMMACGSAFSIMKSNLKNEFYEEELFEGEYSNNIFYMKAAHSFVTINKSFTFSFELPNLKESLLVQNDGSVIFKDKVNTSFILNNEHTFDYVLQGNTRNRAFVSLACMSKKAFGIVSEFFFENMKDKFLCTNLRPDSFISAFILTVPYVMEITDFIAFQKSLNVLRTDSTGPKCLGGE